MTDVTQETFDHFEGLTWTREGVKTRAYQDQGIDFVLTQGPGRSITCSSEPGFHLFTALGAYLRQQSNHPMPEVEALRRLTETEPTDATSPYRVNARRLLLILPETIASSKDNVIRSEGTTRDIIILNYRGFIEGTQLVIAERSKNKLGERTLLERGRDPIPTVTPLDVRVRLEPEDALPVMQTIYYYAKDRKGLENLYQTIRERPTKEI